MNINLLAGGSEPNNDIGNPALGPVLQAISNLGGPTDFFNRLLPAAVSLLFIIGSIIFFFMLITGAIQWIASAGDKQALEGARGKITNAIIGIVILFATFAIVQLIETFFGVNILTIDIGPLVIQ